VPEAQRSYQEATIFLAEANRQFPCDRPAWLSVRLDLVDELRRRD